MKLSELIYEAAKMQHEYGDVDVKLLTKESKEAVDIDCVLFSSRIDEAVIYANE